jgi:hypothetical protein
MHSKVRTSSSRSKKSSTPSPYIRTRTFLTSLSLAAASASTSPPSAVAGAPLSQRTWYTSLVMAPLSGITCSARQSATSAHDAAISCSSRRASLGIRGCAAASAARWPWLWFSIATILANHVLLPFFFSLTLFVRDQERRKAEAKWLEMRRGMANHAFYFFSFSSIWISFRSEIRESVASNKRTSEFSSNLIRYRYDSPSGIKERGRV